MATTKGPGLFGPRFAQHSETVRHGVASSRPKKQLTGLSDPNLPSGASPFSPEVYQASDSKPTLTRGKTKRDRQDRPLRELSLMLTRRKFPKGSLPSVPRPEANPHDTPTATPNPPATLRLRRRTAQRSPAAAWHLRPLLRQPERHHHDTPRYPLTATNNAGADPQTEQPT